MAESSPEDVDHATSKHLAMFKSMPPDVERSLTRGPVKGIWLVPHPLQLHPASYMEIMATVQESIEHAWNWSWRWCMSAEMKMKTNMNMNMNMMETESSTTLYHSSSTGCVKFIALDPRH